MDQKGIAKITEFKFYSKWKIFLTRTLLRNKYTSYGGAV